MHAQQTSPCAQLQVLPSGEHNGIIPESLLVYSFMMLTVTFLFTFLIKKVNYKVRNIGGKTQHMLLHEVIIDS